MEVAATATTVAGSGHDHSGAAATAMGSREATAAAGGGGHGHGPLRRPRLGRHGRAAAPARTEAAGALGLASRVTPTAVEVAAAKELLPLLATCGDQFLGVRKRGNRVGCYGFRIGSGRTPCGGGCRGRFAGLGPERPLGQRPRELPPPLAHASPLLPRNGGFLLASAANPVDAAAALATRGGRRRRGRTGGWPS